MVKETEALYNAFLSIKIVSFDDIVQTLSSIIESSANRKYILSQICEKADRNWQIPFSRDSS